MALQRDLHANDFGLCEEYTYEIPSGQRDPPSLKAGTSPPAYFWKTRYLLVSSDERSLVWMFFPFCSVVGFFRVLLHCLESTFGYGWLHFWPNRFWYRCEKCFGQSTINSWTTSEQTLVPDTASKLSKLVSVRLTTSMYLKELRTMTLSAHPLGMTWSRLINSPDILQKTFLSSIGSRSASEGCNSAFKQGVVWFDGVRRHLVLENHLCNGIWMLPAICRFQILLTWNLWTWKSDATLLSMSCRSAMVKSSIQPHPDFRSYPVQTPESICVPNWWERLLSFEEIGKTICSAKQFHWAIKRSSKSYIIRRRSIGHFVLYISQWNRSNPVPLSTAFLKDPTSPEMQRYLQQVSLCLCPVDRCQWKFLVTFLWRIDWFHSQCEPMKLFGY